MRNLLILVVLLTSVDAWAGDPCPIEYRFVDLGSPAWLVDDPPLAKLKRQQAWVGISYRQDGERTVITDVHEDSPAARATIRKGDLVLALDGQAIHSKAELSQRLDQARGGQPMTFSVSRGATTLELKVKPDARDPLIFDLIRTVERRECAVASYGQSRQLADQRVENAVFDERRAFRCKDAHRRLLQSDLFPKGTLVVVRGARRVLIATVGWQTTCANAADYDGEVSDARSDRLLDTISSRYVNDRFAHP